MLIVSLFQEFLVLTFSFRPKFLFHRNKNVLLEAPRKSWQICLETLVEYFVYSTEWNLYPRCSVFFGQVSHGYFCRGNRSEKYAIGKQKKNIPQKVQV